MSKTCSMCRDEIDRWDEKRECFKDHGLCFGCNFWRERVDQVEETTAIIDGYWYAPGNRTEGKFRGMAGRRFDIEYFDGRKCTCYDLWSGGDIPEHFREQLPDNARFRQAERVKVGETTCFNPTPGKLEPWPLPKDMEYPDIPFNEGRKNDV